VAHRCVGGPRKRWSDQHPWRWKKPGNAYTLLLLLMGMFGCVDVLLNVDDDEESRSWN